MPQTIVIVPTTKLEDKSSQPWQLYPNPTKNSFSIALDQSYSNINVRILDIQGRLVKEQEFQDQQLLNLGIEGTSGLYFIQVFTPQKEAVFKLIKK